MKTSGALTMRLERHIGAVAPTPDADAGAIHVGKRLQIVHASQLILQLDFSELVINGGLECMAAVIGAAIIEARK